MGHTDRICVGDCGLPIPDETERIDLAVKFGQPTFMDVLKEVGADMKIEAHLDGPVTIVLDTDTWRK